MACNIDWQKIIKTIDTGMLIHLGGGLFGIKNTGKQVTPTADPPVKPTVLRGVR